MSKKISKWTHSLYEMMENGHQINMRKAILGQPRGKENKGGNLVCR